jgi:pyruvate/2-oxoglutarate dehydrogenase complex dihydrolipoamide acyltransferase (E2) component
MTSRPLRGPIAVCLLSGVLALAGCTNPDAPSAGPHTTSTASPQNAGEQPAPAPASPTAQEPADVQPTPAKALTGFSRLYSNWTYRTLTSDQRALAAMSVGAARLAEQQAEASSEADTTIARGRIWNSGQIVSIATDVSRPGTWDIVTREQTGGSTEYEGLPAAYHVTLARLARVPDGFAVSEWLPQS